MYDYYIKDRTKNCGQSSFLERKACAIKAYGSIGDAAINSITDLEKRDDAIKQMSETIDAEIKRAGENRNEMAHVPIKGRYAVDVAPSSINDGSAFKNAVLNHRAVIKDRFFWPGKKGGPPETAYHIEFNVE